MQTTYDHDAGHLGLAFGAAEERAAFIDAARRESGFLVTLHRSLGLHRAVSVELSVRENSITLDARVAQVFDKGFGKFGVAFLIDDWPSATPAPATADHSPIEATTSDPVPSDSVPSGPVPSDSAPPMPDLIESADADKIRTTGEDTTEADPDPEPECDPNEGEVRGTSPIHVIKQMNPRQRSLLAMKATRTQRHILLRDNSPQVLQSLLANPQIDSEEVLQIARSSHVVAPILQRIASDARWGANQEILAIIARHPKTPTIFASRLMPNLRTSDLRMMAKMSSGLREMTRKAALREYMRRTGQRV